MSPAADRLAIDEWRTRLSAHPGWLTGALAVLASALTLHACSQLLPLSEWPAAFWRPDGTDLARALVHDGFLPRLAVCLLAGAALGMAGTLFQQVLRNPLAEPTTLGVSAGAQLAFHTQPHLCAAMARFWPGGYGVGRRRARGTARVRPCPGPRARPPALVLAGGPDRQTLCGLAGSVLTILHHDYLQGISSGEPARWCRTAGARSAISRRGWLLLCARGTRSVRPLALLELDEASARSLGLPVRSTRLLVLSVAVAASAAVVSAVGVIGFVGLAAPALARLTGARRFGDRLLRSPVMGAGLLWLTDQLVQLTTGADGRPADRRHDRGSGAPLLLWLRCNRSASNGESATPGGGRPGTPRWPTWQLLAMLAGLLLAGVGVALMLGGGSEGVGLEPGSGHLPALLPWRAPRVSAALAAGAMLALAGTILQRLTGNSLASPEVLGLSSGATIGAVLMIYLSPEPTRWLLVAAATAGAAASWLWCWPSAIGPPSPPRPADGRDCDRHRHGCRHHRPAGDRRSAPRDAADLARGLDPTSPPRRRHSPAAWPCSCCRWPD